MNFSIIIPARNEEKYIGQCLLSIEKAKKNLFLIEPNCKVEIIVANNQSTDKTSQIAEKYADKIIYTNAETIAGVRNAGAYNAKNEVFIFIDADSVMQPMTLIKILDTITKTKIKAGCVKILPYEKINFFIELIIIIFNWIFKLLNTGSGLFFCLNTDFKAINGFDENIVAGEDLNFAYRIKKYLKTKNLKFKNLFDIPIRTSMRKLKFVKIKSILLLIINFFIFNKRIFENKKLFEKLYYAVEDLR